MSTLLVLQVMPGAKRLHNMLE